MLSRGTVSLVEIIWVGLALFGFVNHVLLFAKAYLTRRQMVIVGQNGADKLLQTWNMATNGVRIFIKLMPLGLGVWAMFRPELPSPQGKVAELLVSLFFIVWLALIDLEGAMQRVKDKQFEELAHKNNEQ